MAYDRRQPCKGASPCGWSPRRQSSNESDKRGLNSKIHLAVDAHGMPVRVIITEGSRADCTVARELIEGMEAGALIADRGYDTDAIVEQAESQCAEVVIPPKKNRRIERSYDKYLYKLRHLVENAFLRLKGWRDIATRYVKNEASFLAAVQIRCLFLWLNIS